MGRIFIGKTVQICGLITVTIEWLMQIVSCQIVDISLNILIFDIKITMTTFGQTQSLSNCYSILKMNIPLGPTFASQVGNTIATIYISLLILFLVILGFDFIGMILQNITNYSRPNTRNRRA